MGNLKLRLEPVEDVTSKKMMEDRGETEVEFFRWQRHAENEEIHLVKTKNAEGLIAVTIFGKSGMYVPRYDEILLIKQHFLAGKLALVKMGTSITEIDDLTIPIAINLFEYPNPKTEEEPSKIITKENKLIIPEHLKRHVN